MIRSAVEPTIHNGAGKRKGEAERKRLFATRFLQKLPALLHELSHVGFASTACLFDGAVNTGTEIRLRCALMVDGESLVSG